MACRQVPVQVRHRRRHRLEHPVLCSQTLQLVQHRSRHALLQPLPQFLEHPTMLVCRQAHGGQSQPDVVQGVTPVQGVGHLCLVQADALDHPGQPLPDPWRPVGQEHHHLRTRRPQPVQVHRQQFHDLVGALETAIDPRPALAGHPAVVIDLVDGQQLGLAPLTLVTSLLLLLVALAFLLARGLAQPNPPAVELHGDAFAGELGAGWDPA